MITNLKNIYDFLNNSEKRSFKIILSCGLVNLFLELLTLSLVLPILYYVLEDNKFTNFIITCQQYIFLFIFMSSIIIKNIFYFSNQYMLKF